MIAVLLRVGVLALAFAGLFLVLGAMGAGVRSVVVGALLAAAVWLGVVLWARADARRSAARGPVLLRWGWVTALLVLGYAVAGWRYGEEMPLAEIGGQSVALGAVLVLLPAALGIARGPSVGGRVETG